MQSLKNACIKWALSFVRKDKPPKESTSRFLVVSTTGLGDSIWGTPAIRALRKRYPRSYIAVLTHAIGEQIFRYNPYIDDIVVLPRSLLFFLPKLIRTLKQASFDTAYLFHTSQRLILPSIFIANPSKIVGTAGAHKGLDCLCTHLLPNSPIHEIERRLEMVNGAGCSPKMELFLTEEENAVACDHFIQGVPMIGIHPGAQDRFKQWDPKYFSELGALLVKEKNAKILVTGSASEQRLAKQVAKHIPGAVSIAGTLSVRSFAALLGKLDGFITNDTGPMHLAIAMETPTWAIFAPTDPNLCGPYKTSHAVVVQKPPSCVPCLKKKCAAPFCLSQISPSMVYEVIDAHADF